MTHLHTRLHDECIMPIGELNEADAHESCSSLRRGARIIKRPNPELFLSHRIPATPSIYHAPFISQLYHPHSNTPFSQYNQ